jgi:hypothetical protein
MSDSSGDQLVSNSVLLFRSAGPCQANARGLDGSWHQTTTGIRLRFCLANLRLVNRDTDIIASDRESRAKGIAWAAKSLSNDFPNARLTRKTDSEFGDASGGLGSASIDP